MKDARLCEVCGEWRGSAMGEPPLTPRQLAAWAQVSEKTVLRAIASGDLHAGRAGCQLRIDPDEGRRWVFGHAEPSRVIRLPHDGDSVPRVHSDEGGSP